MKKHHATVLILVQVQGGRCCNSPGSGLAMLAWLAGSVALPGCPQVSALDSLTVACPLTAPAPADECGAIASCIAADDCSAMGRGLCRPHSTGRVRSPTPVDLPLSAAASPCQSLIRRQCLQGGFELWDSLMFITPWRQEVGIPMGTLPSQRLTLQAFLTTLPLCFRSLMCCWVTGRAPWWRPSAAFSSSHSP